MLEPNVHEQYSSSQERKWHAMNGFSSGYLSLADGANIGHCGPVLPSDMQIMHRRGY